MDREELDGSSSSPSVKNSILTISQKGTQGRAAKVCLSGGSFFYAPMDTAAQLRPGMSFSDRELRDLIFSCESRLAYLKAVDLLARREHSRRELEIKLVQREFSRPAVEAALNEAQERRYLDDERFARLFVESRNRRKPQSRRKIEADLAKKGIDRHLAAGILDELRTEDQEAEALEAALEKQVRRGKSDSQKIAAALIRQGFSPGKVFQVVKINNRVK